MRNLQFFEHEWFKYRRRFWLDRSIMSTRSRASSNCHRLIFSTRLEFDWSTICDDDDFDLDLASTLETKFFYFWLVIWLIFVFLFDERSWNFDEILKSWRDLDFVIEALDVEVTWRDQFNFFDVFNFESNFWCFDILSLMLIYVWLRVKHCFFRRISFLLSCTFINVAR